MTIPKATLYTTQQSENPQSAKKNQESPICGLIRFFGRILRKHRENNRREESKYLEYENRQLGLVAIAAYIFKPPTEKFKIGR